MTMDINPKPVPPGLTIAEVIEQQYRDPASQPKAVPAAIATPSGTSCTPFKLPGLESYPGGKGAERTVRLIINQIPPHHAYVEPFIGGGAVMRNKRPAEINYGFDLADNVIELWAAAPHGITVYKRDGLAYIETVAQTYKPDTFLFIDPPYQDETLLSERAPYVHRMPYADHVRLLAAVKQLKCNAMLCALPNALYASELATWRTITYENMTRRGLQTEQVWMNYAEPVILHDTRYIGENYRERERIKRKQASKVRELMALPERERYALLDHINQAIKRP